jgi:hypothetical protein
MLEKVITFITRLRTTHTHTWPRALVAWCVSEVMLGMRLFNCGGGHKLIFFVIGQDQPKNSNSSIRSRGGKSEMFKVTSYGLLGLG